MKDTRREQRIYRGTYACGKSPGAPSEVIAEDLDTIYNGYLDDGDWELAGLPSTSCSTVADHESGIRKSFRRIQYTCRKADQKVH